MYIKPVIENKKVMAPTLLCPIRPAISREEDRSK